MSEETFELTVSAYIRGPRSGTLSVDERVQLPAGDFTVIARTLTRFHGFAERLRAEILGEDQDDVGEEATPEETYPRNVPFCVQHDCFHVADCATYERQGLAQLVKELLDEYVDVGRPGVRTRWAPHNRIVEWNGRLDHLSHCQ